MKDPPKQAQRTLFRGAGVDKEPAGALNAP